MYILKFEGEIYMSLIYDIITKRRQNTEEFEEIVNLGNPDKTQKNMNNLVKYARYSAILLSDKRMGREASTNNYLETISTDKSGKYKYIMRAKLDKNLNVCGSYFVVDANDTVKESCVFYRPELDQKYEGCPFVVISKKSPIYVTCVKLKNDRFAINTHSTIIDGCKEIAETYDKITSYVGNKNNSSLEFNPDEIDFSRE